MPLAGPTQVYQNKGFASGGATTITIQPSQLRTPTLAEVTPMMERFVSPAQQRPNPSPQRQPVSQSAPAMGSSAQQQQNLRSALNNYSSVQGTVGEPDFKRGGEIKGMAGGGIPTSEALSPWYARAEERGAVQPEGLVGSTGAGRTDVHNIQVPAGSYIVPADVTSGLGEGNTLAGSNVIDRMMHSNPYGIQNGNLHKGGIGIPRAPAPYRETEARGGAPKGEQHGLVPIVIAGGEHVIYPQTIIQKFGDLKKGHAVLDKFVVNTRQKTIQEMRKLKGPKGAAKK